MSAPPIAIGSGAHISVETEPILNVGSKMEDQRTAGVVEFGETIQCEAPEDFTNIALDEVGSPQGDGAARTQVPKRVLHFSDGILEESSTDENTQEKGLETATIDPRQLDWFPWIWFYFVAMAFGALAVADCLGEKLAWFFGITSPKYQYAIDEHNRIAEEEQEETEREEREEAAARERYLQTISSMEGAVSSPTEPQTAPPTQPAANSNVQPLDASTIDHLVTSDHHNGSMQKY